MADFRDEWVWMQHPSRNAGRPIPAQVFTAKDGKRYYRPFDDSASEFLWSERDGEWRDVPSISDAQILAVADSISDLDGGSSSSILFARAILAATSGVGEVPGG